MTATLLARGYRYGRPLPAALQEALAWTGCQPADKPPQGIERLLALVEAVTGQRDSPQMRNKLHGLLGDFHADTVETWRRRLDGQPINASGWQTVLERVGDTEGWFHRDPALVKALRKKILPALIAAKRKSGHTAIRLWSAGCAGGEEAYSLAILLLEALVEAGEAEETAPGMVAVKPEWRLAVVGSDIHAGAIGRAHEGAYAAGPNGSFRSMPEAWRRFFAPCGEGVLRIHEPLRSFVFFCLHNLQADGLPISDCDLVLCRNVLGGFAEDGRARAWETIRRALAPTGLVALGETDEAGTGFRPLPGIAAPLFART